MLRVPFCSHSSKVAGGVALLIWSISVSPVFGQVVLKEAPEMAAIRFSRLVTLGDPTGPGFVGSPIDVERRLNGEWVVTSVEHPAEVKFFSPSGEWSRTIGREGDGPGEYGGAWSIFVLEDDRLAIYDSFKHRLTTYSPQLVVEETVSLPYPIFMMLVLPGGRTVVNAQLHNRAQVGLPIHILDSSGALVRSFGADPPVQDWANPYKVHRILASAGDQQLWSAPTGEYVLERWSVSGQRTARLLRGVPWFRPHYGPAFSKDPSVPPNPDLRTLYEDDNGLLWVGIRIPDEQYPQAFEAGRDGYGRERLIIKDENLYYDTKVEVIDLATGTVVASEVFDPTVWGVTREGFLIAHSYREDGEFFIEVWQPQLNAAPRSIR